MMNKTRVRRDLMREQLAHQAARLMAEDGITDYAFAKRKAARQMGAADSRHMPSNEEIESALRSFRNLFQADRHPAVLRQLRRQALNIMEVLEAFHPFLTGPVLDGTAGEQSVVDLQVYSDNDKAVMLLLMKEGLEFEASQWSMRLAGREQTIPGFVVQSGDDVVVRIAVLPENARHGGGHKTETHADKDAVFALVRIGE